MRRFSLLLLVMLLAIALGLGALACGGNETGSGKTPEEAVTAALDTVKTANSLSGTYKIDLTVQAEESDSNPMAQALLGQAIAITGNFAMQKDPVLADLSLALDLMGQSLSIGVRAIDQDVWLNVLDQWYEVPAESLQTGGEPVSPDVLASLQQTMDEQGIDPTTWYTDLKVVGTETLADTEVSVSHLTGTLDVEKMLTDVVGLLQSPEVAALMGDATTAASDTGVSLPDATATEELQTTLEEMFKGATLDLWIADKDDSLRRAVLSAELAMPEDLATSGVNGATVVVTVNLDAPDEPVEVSAPTSAKPLSDLETDLASNPLLSGLSGLLGSGSGLGDILGQ